MLTVSLPRSDKRMVSRSNEPLLKRILNRVLVGVYRSNSVAPKTESNSREATKLQELLDEA